MQYLLKLIKSYILLLETGKYKDLFVDSIQFEQEIKEVNSTIDSVDMQEMMMNLLNFISN